MKTKTTQFDRRTNAGKGYSHRLPGLPSAAVFFMGVK